MEYFVNICYNSPATDGVQGGRHSLRKGGDAHGSISSFDVDGFICDFGRFDTIIS